jgi:hypothetical protein
MCASCKKGAEAERSMRRNAEEHPSPEPVVLTTEQAEAAASAGAEVAEKLDALNEAIQAELTPDAQAGVPTDMVVGVDLGDGPDVTVRYVEVEAANRWYAEELIRRDASLTAAKAEAQYYEVQSKDNLARAEKAEEELAGVKKENETVSEAAKRVMSELEVTRLAHQQTNAVLHDVRAILGARNEETVQQTALRVAGEAEGYFEHMSVTNEVRRILGTPDGESVVDTAKRVVQANILITGAASHAATGAVPTCSLIPSSAPPELRKTVDHLLLAWDAYKLRHWSAAEEAAIVALTSLGRWLVNFDGYASQWRAGLRADLSLRATPPSDPKAT